MKGSAARPADLNGLNGRGVPEPDLLPERVAAEASAGVDGAANGALARSTRDGKLYARADGGAVGFHAHKLELQPVVAMAGIRVEDVRVGIAGDSAAHILMDVLVAVVVEVREGDAVPLL